MFGGFEFQRHNAARNILGLGARADLFGHPPDVSVKDVGIIGIIMKRGFV